jgi:hypothetical protein
VEKKICFRVILTTSPYLVETKDAIFTPYEIKSGSQIQALKLKQEVL